MTILEVLENCQYNLKTAVYLSNLTIARLALSQLDASITLLEEGKTIHDEFQQ